MNDKILTALDYYRNGDDALVQWRRLHDAQGVRIAAHS